MLGDLEQRFNSLEDGGKNLVEQVMNYSNPFPSSDFKLYILVQAKRLAAQQTAKGWFGF